MARDKPGQDGMLELCVSPGSKGEEEKAAPAFFRRKGENAAVLIRAANLPPAAALSIFEKRTENSWRFP
jgi:hypothetical protein